MGRNENVIVEKKMVSDPVSSMTSIDNTKLDEWMWEKADRLVELYSEKHIDAAVLVDKIERMKGLVKILKEL
jgi:3-mercaptopyruvate sulfurtransferase SseA